MMRMITAKEWKAYNDGVAEISDKTEQEVIRRLLAWNAANPGATVAETREYAKTVMEALVRSGSSLASSFAAKWYDYRAEQEHVKLDQAITAAVYNPKKTDAVARYQAKKLVAGSFGEFAKACGEYARNDALRALNETIMANAKRDRSKGVRFARVPTGRETCTFCVMLAGRGAVYHTRESAGEFGHFHRHCDCKVVPGFEDDPMAELVEGHDPKDAYEAWRRVKQIDADGGLSDSDKEEVKARIARARGIYGGKQGKVLYAKPRLLLNEQERAGIDYLAIRGFDVETVAENPIAPANLDVSINGTLWEMKNLSNSVSSVSNQVKRARIKWFKLGIDEPAMCIFTNKGNEDGFDETCTALEGKRRTGEVFMVLSGDGDLRILRDK